MADIVQRYRTEGDQQAIAANQALDAAFVKQTESLHKQNEQTSKAAQQMRQLREAQRAEEQQLRRAKTLIDQNRSAEERQLQTKKDLEVARRQGLISQAKMNQLLNQSAAANGLAGNSTAGLTSGLKNVALSVTGVGSAVGGFLAVVNQLRREYDNLIERQTSTGDSRRTFDVALRGAIRNTDKILTPEQVRDESLALADAANISPARAATVVGAAVTSTGVKTDQDRERALQAARIAAITAPELSDQELGARAGAAGSLSTRFNISPEEALGYLQRLQVAANVSDASKLGQAATPALFGLTQFGFSEGAAGSLFAEISQGAADTEGRVSRTASLALARELEERFSGQAGFTTADGRFNPLAAIQALSNDSDLRNRFFKGGDFFGTKHGKADLGEAQAIPVIRELLTGGSLTNQRFLSGIEQLGTFRGAGDDLRRVQDGINRVTQVDQIGRVIESGTEQIRAVNQNVAIVGELEKLTPLLQSAGVSDAGQRIASLIRQVRSQGGSDASAAAQVASQGLDAIADDLSDGQELEFYIPPNPLSPLGNTFVVPTRDATSEELATAELLRNIGDKLDALLVVNEEQRDLQEAAPAAARGNRMRDQRWQGGLTGRSP